MGWKPYAMRGIPKPRQLAPRQSNEPPCSCDLRLASRIASYSRVSGACWPLPHGLVGSKEGCPAKVPTRRTPLHCPFQSGYLISSPAATAPTTIASAAASGATFSAKAPIVLRPSIAVLPCASAACLRLDLSDPVALVGWVELLRNPSWASTPGTGRRWVSLTLNPSY